MILIFSRSNDYTTFEVMKWLNHFGRSDVVRINCDEDNDIRFDIRESGFSLRVNGDDIQLNRLGAAWYRKGLNWLGGQFNEVFVEDHPELTNYLNILGCKENQKLSEYIHYLIQQRVPVLGSAFKSDLNKLVTLDLAQSVGLKIPPFHVVNETQSVARLLEGDQEYITKAMSDGVYLFESENRQRGYFTYTESVSRECIAGCPEKISPSFMQSKIEKRYEVRVFYLDGRCYSWAILSQADAQTSTDYRKYNEQKPNRVLPYKLPGAVEEQLTELFLKVGLNTGSVDLMVDSRDEHYFLEINPVGQFGVLSRACNYQLEAEVAKWLIEHAK